MKKNKSNIFCTIITVFILCITLSGCSKKEIYLGGFYQSNHIGTDIVQITVKPDTNEFIEYISNREVNTGTCEKQEDGTYLFTGDTASFSAVLNENDTLSITIEKLNGDSPIELKQINKDKHVFTTIEQESYDDAEEYKKLLTE